MTEPETATGDADPIPSWNPRALTIYTGLAVLIGALWLVPAVQSALFPLDEGIFKALNGSLASSTGWARLWAFLNTRKFDLMAGLVMGLFFLIPGLVYKGRELFAAGFEFLAIFLVSSVFRAVVSASVAPRPSPSHFYHPNFNNLLNMFPEIGAKVSAHHSFPSDHAVVVLIWMLFMLYSSKRPGRLLAVPYAMFISTPRLVGGAHWMTDILMGSIPLTLLGFAWGYFTPLRTLAHRAGVATASKILGPAIPEPDNATHPGEPS